MLQHLRSIYSTLFMIWQNEQIVWIEHQLCRFGMANCCVVTFLGGSKFWTDSSRYLVCNWQSAPFIGFSEWQKWFLNGLSRAEYGVFNGGGRFRWWCPADYVLNKNFAPLYLENHHYSSISLRPFNLLFARVDHFCNISNWPANPSSNATSRTLPERWPERRKSTRYLSRYLCVYYARTYSRLAPA